MLKISMACFDYFVHGHDSRFSGDISPLRHGDAHQDFVSSRMTATSVLIFPLVLVTEPVFDYDPA
jgi:hypothetical protein